MKIKQTIYNQIINTPKDTPPETGGILGGNNDIITTYRHDDGLPSPRTCCYIPNTKVINTVIHQWQQEGIEFMGIYHTHFWEVGTLSEGDKTYIKKILKSMPMEIKHLYFPLVVMPSRIMICYIAKYVAGTLTVDKYDLTII